MPRKRPRSWQALRKRGKYYLRVFRCPDCGGVEYAPRTHGMTKNGHVKDLWCHACKAEKKMEQIGIIETRRL